ncbi:FAD-binding oxidoreductase [Allorhizocola rhizosphaerae]|uniref:FAD-binding oxidoreductase n=1 Tax=Allorhizocola rhizosphaerae TaxID=1872709 RepID=UPI000E3E2F89|nr:FAD-binding oxidoreductase [Allorhizocola rhizosphaerae]
MPLDLSGLRDAFRGTIVTPFDPDYEGVRVVFNNRVRTRPSVICRCRDTEDVVTAVRFAREAGLPVSIRGGGHHACGYSLVDDGLVIDVRGLGRISFDPGAATVVAGAGCGWRDVDQVTYVGHGYAAPGGECPTVGNAGYSMGGGYGFLSRRYGLACDHILAAELVDADGRVLRVTEDEHPDLLWALRGAGGAGFGVVTRLKYRLDPVPRTIFGGAIAWPLDDAEAVFRAYRDMYVGREEDRLSLYLALMAEPYPHGQPVLMAYGMHVGPPDGADKQLAPLRAAAGEPVFDTFGLMSYYDLQQALGSEIMYGLQLKWRGGFFREGGFGDQAFASIVDAFRHVPSGYSMARFDLLGGGAIGAVAADATAFVHRSSMFNISIIAQWVRGNETEANLRWTEELMIALAPHLSGEVYQNYADEELEDWPSAYYGTNYARLQEVKRRYDPADFFHHPQSIRLPE